MDLEKTMKSLKDRGFAVSCFATAAEASDYLNGQIDGTTVGVGGSMTLKDMGMYESLSAHNAVYWHWYPQPDPVDPAGATAATAEVYLSSVNGLAESGEIINIDGTGNRVASMLYGHKRLYLVAGINKIAENYEAALWRARNVASPKNAQRLDRKTPCAAKAERCYDCKSPERICRGLAVLWTPMNGVYTEVVLIGEELGF